jgi:hypothetical protein
MQNPFFVEKYARERQKEINKNLETETMKSGHKNKKNKFVKMLVFLFFPDSSRIYEKMIADEKEYRGAVKVIICIIQAILIMVFISFLVK